MSPKTIISTGVVVLVIGTAFYISLIISAIAGVSTITSRAASIQAFTSLELSQHPIDVPEASVADLPVTTTTILGVEEVQAEQPAVDPWTAELAAAHIPSGEQSAARALLFNESSWREYGSSMLPATKPIPDTQQRIKRIYIYVLQKYGGWNEAKAHADANGGIW